MDKEGEKTTEETINKLLDFKQQIKSAILGNGNLLPIYTTEKVFDFRELSFKDRVKQQLSINPKSIIVLVKLLQIVQIVLDLLWKRQTITKRNLYYKLVNYYSAKYQKVSVDIDLLCFNLKLKKEDLGIYSSSRCLVSGYLTLSIGDTTVESQPTLITNIPILQQVKSIDTHCFKLVIIQKQSALYQIHQQIAREVSDGNKAIQKIMQQTIFISAKGYPDSTTRTIIQALLPQVQQIFFLGDNDIYGLDILLCYSIAYRQWSTFLHRINWIQLQTILDKQSLISGQLPQKKEDRQKCIQIMEKPFFKQIEFFIPQSIEGEGFRKKLLRWKEKVKEMSEGKPKLQLQTLLREMPKGWIEKALTASCCL